MVQIPRMNSMERSKFEGLYQTTPKMRATKNTRKRGIETQMVFYRISSSVGYGS
jgi:hypothetical protein